MEATLLRRTRSVQRLARSFGTNKQTNKQTDRHTDKHTSCYFIIRIFNSPKIAVTISWEEFAQRGTRLSVCKNGGGGGRENEKGCGEKKICFLKTTYDVYQFAKNRRNINLNKILST